MFIYYADRSWRTEHREHFDAWLHNEFPGQHVTRVELIGEGAGCIVTYLEVTANDVVWQSDIVAFRTGPPPPCCLREIEER